MSINAGSWIELVANIFTFAIILLLVYLCFDWRYLSGRFTKWLRKKFRGCIRRLKATRFGGKMCGCCPDYAAEDEREGADDASVWSVHLPWTETPPPYEVALTMPRPLGEEDIPGTSSSTQGEAPVVPQPPQQTTVDMNRTIDSIADTGHTNEGYEDNEDEGIDTRSFSNMPMEKGLPSYIEALDILQKVKDPSNGEHNIGVTVVHIDIDSIPRTSLGDDEQGGERQGSQSNSSSESVAFTIGQTVDDTTIPSNDNCAEIENADSDNSEVSRPDVNRQSSFLHHNTQSTDTREIEVEMPVEEPLSRPPSYSTLPQPLQPPSYSTLHHNLHRFSSSSARQTNSIQESSPFAEQSSSSLPHIPDAMRRQRDMTRENSRSSIQEVPIAHPQVNPSPSITTLESMDRSNIANDSDA